MKTTYHQTTVVSNCLRSTISTWKLDSIPYFDTLWAISSGHLASRHSNASPALNLELYNRAGHNFWVLYYQTPTWSLAQNITVYQFWGPWSNVLHHCQKPELTCLPLIMASTFWRLAMWYNVDLETPNLVHSHILAQTSGWSLKINTKKFGLPIIYNAWAVGTKPTSSKLALEPLDFWSGISWQP